MACNDERCIFPDPEMFELMVTPNATGEVVVAEPTSQNTTGNSAGKENHTAWSYAIQSVSDKEYLLSFTATMEPGSPS
jgi:hypothetical protein